MKKFCPFIKGTCLMNQCGIYDENGQVCSFIRLDYLPEITFELTDIRCELRKSCTEPPKESIDIESLRRMFPPLSEIDLEVQE